jgi:hypothetical protein
LKLRNLPSFVFFFKSNRVLLNPVFKLPVPGACGAPILTVAAGGGGPAVAPPPGPRFQTLQTLDIALLRSCENAISSILIVSTYYLHCLSFER